MSKLDILGHIFYFMLFSGTMLVQSKKYQGWFLRFAGEAGWTGIGIAIGMSSIWLWGIAFMVIDLLGYMRWRR